MAQQYFPYWLSPRCFLAALFVTAIGSYAVADRTGFSTEGIVGWIIGSVVGGVFWGWVCTLAYRKFDKKQ